MAHPHELSAAQIAEIADAYVRGVSRERSSGLYSPGALIPEKKIFAQASQIIAEQFQNIPPESTEPSAPEYMLATPYQRLQLSEVREKARTDFLGPEEAGMLGSYLKAYGLDHSIVYYRPTDFLAEDIDFAGKNMEVITMLPDHLEKVSGESIKTLAQLAEKTSGLFCDMSFADHRFAKTPLPLHQSSIFLGRFPILGSIQALPEEAEFYLDTYRQLVANAGVPSAKVWLPTAYEVVYALLMHRASHLYVTQRDAIFPIISVMTGDVSDSNEAIYVQTTLPDKINIFARNPSVRVSNSAIFPCRPSIVHTVQQ